MSLITQQTTAVTGNTITAAVWNDEWSNIINDYNGGITNANISASAAIADSKINFTGSANTYPKANGSGGVTWASLSTNNGFGWLVKGTITVANEISMKWPVPTTMTCSAIWAKTESGTATIRIQKDTTDVKSSLSVTSTLTQTTSFDSTSLTAGQLLTLDVTAASGTDLYILLWVTTG